MFTATNGPCARRDCRWSDRAISSLPVPLSPVKSVAHDPGDGLELAPARGFELPLRVVQAMDDGNQVKSPGTVSEGHRLARTQKSNVHAYMLSSSRASTSSCSAGESLGVNQRWATTVGTTAEPMTT